MTAGCDVQAAGSIELFFYGELPERGRLTVEAHLSRCPECRRALADLSAIRAALASGRDVSSPPGGDWSAFMARLDARCEAESAGTRLDTAPGRGLASVPGSVAETGDPRPWGIALAIAASLVLVTLAVLALVSERHRVTPDPEPAAEAAFSGGIRPGDNGPPDAALASLEGQHFARSKLVVLGLAMRDTTVAGEGDWTYEWDLASSLLSDTRLYRIAAEERGMVGLAGTLRDLELVLLEASMAQQPDRPALEQVQRLIRRRDLVTKMNTVSMAN